MKKTLKIEIGFILLCLLYAFFSLPLSCEAAETEVREVVIPIEQLTTLEVELNKASKAIANSKTDSELLQKQLRDLQIALTAAKQQSAQLTEQLKALTITSKQQETQLKSANKSLDELSVKMKQERKSLERQRNIAYIIAAGLLYAAVR